MLVLTRKKKFFYHPLEDLRVERTTVHVYVTPNTGLLSFSLGVLLIVDNLWGLGKNSGRPHLT